MAEWMADVFIELVNRSIAASWLVLAVLILRLLLRRGPQMGQRSAVGAGRVPSCVPLHAGKRAEPSAQQ